MSQQAPVVYRSLGQVWRCLTGHKVKNVPEVRALLQLCLDTGLVKDVGGGDAGDLAESVKGRSPKAADYPFVVIEGLDGCGKTTLTRYLSTKLNMRLIPTPPKNYAIFTEARGYFDCQPESIRRAFYSLGNYLAAVDVANSSQPVIMDRYWHSTASYAVANEVKSGNSTIESWHLEWPSDLLQPDLVIFLEVSEKERVRRHASRNDFTNTQEEQTLAKDNDFRRNLVDCYKSVLGPPFMELNVDGTTKESKSRILDAVLEAFPALKERMEQEQSA